MVAAAVARTGVGVGAPLEPAVWGRRVRRGARSTVGSPRPAGRGRARVVLKAAADDPDASPSEPGTRSRQIHACVRADVADPRPGHREAGVVVDALLAKWVRVGACASPSDRPSSYPVSRCSRSWCVHTRPRFVPTSRPAVGSCGCPGWPTNYHCRKTRLLTASAAALAGRFSWPASAQRPPDADRGSRAEPSSAGFGGPCSWPSRGCRGSPSVLLFF